MSQQGLDDTDTTTHTLADRLPERPVESKAQIMHDTGTEYFDHWVNNCYRTEVLVRYLEIETDRAEPRQDRVGKANSKLMELRE